MSDFGFTKSIILQCKVADKCPACHTMSEINLTVYHKVFMLVLPLFPSGNGADVVCCTCKANIPLMASPRYVSARYIAALKSSKPPKWAYSGTFIVGFAIVAGLISMPFTMSKHKGYINSPHIGDVYEIKYEDNSAIFNSERYTLLRVIDTTATSITFNTCLYEATGTKKLGELRAMPDDELWLDDTVTYTKAQLIKDLDIMAERHIWDINRK